MIQLNFNLVDQRIIENGILEKCDDQGIAIFARTPLCFGLLTGDYATHQNFHTNDHRGKWSESQIKIWATAFSLFGNKIPDYAE